MSERIQTNKDTWNRVSELFVDASSLPSWGPFSVGKDLDLIGETKDKVFLEIACGSGRSLKYLLDRGARKVYGIDFSENQLAEAARYNERDQNNGRLELVNTTMEAKVKIEPVDVAFSIYGIGWTENPKKTFSNIYSYLKPGGIFVWSWDHSIFTDIAYEDGKFSVVYSYHNEKPITIKDWKKKGCNAHITYRKSATWFRFLKEAGFNIEGYYEPEPIDLSRGFDDPAKYYSIQRAKLIPSTFIFVCKKKE
jgi:SAM-dependent methyltransferase